MSWIIPVGPESHHKHPKLEAEGGYTLKGRRKRDLRGRDWSAEATSQGERAALKVGEAPSRFLGPPERRQRCRQVDSSPMKPIWDSQPLEQ